MRIGCDLPYFVDPGDISAFAQAAEEIGYRHLGFSEHVAASHATDYGSPVLLSVAGTSRTAASRSTSRSDGRHASVTGSS
ncbi:MAG: hypothetical protein ACRDVW_01700 [Acidimicrobiales bacterium]